VFLFGPDGRVVDRYDKQHLVPFGEYLPLDRFIPPLRRFAPLGYSCTPGRKATVFRLPGSGAPLSSLICFEDIVAPLSRAFVRGGARLLVNQTNDGWFDRTAQPVQHLGHSVLRAVENRVPVVRAANSGVTCWIDARGRVHEPTVNSARVAPEPQTRVWTIVLPPEDRPLTAYTRWGDWTLALPCAGFALVVLAAALVRRAPAR
jgi:apolipoprotein N-acyltransferase